MKKMLLKNLATLAVLAMTTASADDIVINLAGSTALRAAVNAALQPDSSYAYTDGSLSESTYAIFKFSDSNGDNYIIRAYWGGSVQGVDYPNRNTSVSCFIPTTQTTTFGGTSLGSTTYSDSGIVHAGMSTINKATAGYIDADLQEFTLGVIPYVFVTHPNAPFTNMNPQLMQQVYQQAYAFLSNFYTGGSNSVPVYGCGRNPSSGTQAIILAETGYGYTNSMYDYTATNNGTNTTAFNYSGVNAGESTGTAVAKMLALPSSDTVGWGVGYVAVSELQPANKVMTYNGTTYSADAIKNGSYTLWSYAHCFVSAFVRDDISTVNNKRRSFIYGLINGLQADLSGAAGIKVSDMTVMRNGDGSPIFNNY